MTEEDKHQEVSQEILKNVSVGGNLTVGNITQINERYARSRNEQILLRAVKDEVETRLESSLHHAVFLNLGKEAQPDQVKRPWDSEIKIGAKAVQAIPDDTTIAQIFESPEIKGKLLILGRPGSGKTTTLLDLAAALLKKAEEYESYPIPVLFNLSSWRNEKQLIRDWMVTELNSKYGFSTKLGQRWVTERVLLPLLDGLDEVAPERQEKCTEQINIFLKGEFSPLYAVVCSRIAEYENYKTSLQLNGAVYLKELSDEQIQVYLAELERDDLWQLLAQSTELLTLVRTPLLLSMTVIAYPQGSIKHWQPLENANDQLQYLLDTYLEQMLHREFESRAYGKRKAPNTQRTRLWLIWLARQMEKTSQTEFLMEEMQPFMLPKNSRIPYRIIWRLFFGLSSGLSSGLVFGLVFGVGSELFFGLSSGLSSGLVFGLSSGLGSGLFFGLSSGLIWRLGWGSYSNIEVVEIHLASMKRLQKRLKKKDLNNETVRVLLGLMAERMVVRRNTMIQEAIFCVFLGLIGGLIGGLFSSLFSRLFSGLFLGQVSGLFWAVFWSDYEASSTIEPVEVLFVERLEKSLIGALSFGLIGALSFGLIGALSFGLIGRRPVRIERLFLRLLLYLSKAIPWNYPRFLNYSTELLFLQRVGRRYRFMHKLLQEHFARMPMDR